MFKVNYDYSQHVWYDMFMVIVSVDFPENRQRVINLQKQLEKFGINPAYTCLGKKSPSKNERDGLVFKCHRDICDWFVQKRPCKYLFILEDDAYICDKKAPSKIRRYINKLKYLDRHWVVLSLGCVALQGISHVEDDLYRGKGVAAQAYIHNGDTLEHWLNKIPAKEWRCPYAVECWSKFPDKHIYMLHPILISQEVHVCGFLPGFGNQKFFPNYVNFINGLNAYRNYILAIAIVMIAIKSPKPITILGFTILFITVCFIGFTLLYRYNYERKVRMILLSQV